MTGVTYRQAGSDDALAIADLHTDSWRRHYRGAYSDAFLDGPVAEDRRALWLSRLEHPDDSASTLLAEHDQVVGFVHVILDADPDWGALVDNLHVSAQWQRRGVGRALLVEAGRTVAEARPASPMHLWVLDQNTSAQAFYLALGGVRAGRKESEPPGGGSVSAIRVVWPDPMTVAQGDPLEPRSVRPSSASSPRSGTATA